MDDPDAQPSGYGVAAPDSLGLFLPLPPSSGGMPPKPSAVKQHAPLAHLRPQFPAAFSPRPLCYPSPRVPSDRTCSSSDAAGDAKAAPHPACVSAARSELETGSFAAAAWSRRTLVHTAATTAASETGALLSSTPVPPPAPPPPPESDGGTQFTDSGDSGASAADTEELSGSAHEQRNHPDDHPTTCQGDRSDERSDEHEASLACPRSPGCSTRSGGSGSGEGSHSAAGVAAALPTPPATPGHPYAGADEIFDVGQLCRRLSHCAAGEVVGLAHRTLHPPTASWPVVMHDHGPIIPHCSGAAYGGRIGRARCDLRAAPGIVACMSGTRATVRDSILHLGAGACMLLDDSCGDVRFEDVCFQGGMIVCRGRGCRLTLARVDLQMCAIIALNGAQVWLHDTSATAAEGGIGVFACGAGTAVHANKVTLTEGLLGVSVQGGARFSGKFVTITGATTAALHACGKGSCLHVRKGHIYDLGKPEDPVAPGQGAPSSQCSGDGSLISQDAVCCFEDTAFERCAIGVEIHSRGCGTLKNCRVHGCSGSAVAVEDAQAELFDCAMDSCGGYGVSLRRGAVQAHGCAVARTTLNSVHLQENSQAVLRWCTLEQSGLWSGLEVEGHGSAAKCHSCLFHQNQHCGVFVHSRGAAALTACETEGNGMSGFRVHGPGARLKLSGCCAKDVVAYQRHHHGVLECANCSPSGHMMTQIVSDDGRVSTGDGRGSTGDVSVTASGGEGAVVEVGQAKKQKKGLFRALVRAFDPKRH